MSDPKSKEEQLNKFERESKVRQKERLQDYEKAYGQKPNIPSISKAEEIYDNINNTEPYFKTAMVGPTARLQQIVSSPEFKAALLEKPSAEGAGKAPEPSKKEKKFAEKASGALRWAVDAFGDAYGGYSNSQAVEGVRQSHQFKELLNTRGPNGRTFYEAMKIAAKKIEVDDPKRAEDDPKKTLFDDFYDDLAYIDHAFKMGIDLPKRDPESKVKVHPELITNWSDYKREYMNNVPHDPEEKKDCLARVLLGSFEAGLAPENRDAFSLKSADKFVAVLKKKPIFKKLCEDPARVNELLKADPNDPEKHYKALLDIYNPFANVSKEKANAALLKIKSMLPHMDGKEGRGDKWKELVKSIESIDVNDPKNSGKKKLKEIFDKTTDYSKGKKSLRTKKADQNRFDQSMDVLAELGNCSVSAKMAAEAVIDRTNEVRLGHDRNYKEIKLKGFGASQIGKHTNKRPAKYATDVLPDDPRALPPMPEKQMNAMSPVAEYTDVLEPLASDRHLNDVEAIQSVASAIALSRAPVYYYDKEPKQKDTLKMLKEKGKAVLNSSRLLNDVMKLQNDPEVKKIAMKYKDPEARKELFAEGRPELALVTEKNKINKNAKENKTYKRSELPLNKKGDPDLTKLKPDKVIKAYSKVGFDVSKFDAKKITQEYEQAKNPVQKMPGQ